MFAAGGATKLLFSPNNYCFNPPFSNKIISIAAKAKKRDDNAVNLSNNNNSAEESSQFSLFNLKISVSTSKLLIQSAISLFALGFVDAGYSGDWSRIGAISKETEELLKMLAFIVAPLCIFLVYSLSAKEKES